MPGASSRHGGGNLQAWAWLEEVLASLDGSLQGLLLLLSHFSCV